MIDSPEEKPRAGSWMECRICLGEHDEDIHAATVSVHAWWRAHVTKYFAEEMEEQCVA
jgi:hypothetical protein